MAGVHRLEHVESLTATDLANDDAVRSHPERGTEERSHIDRSGSLDARRSRLKGDDIGLWEPQFGGVFDRDDPFAFPDREREGIQCRRLAARGAARHEQALPLPDGADKSVDDLAGGGPVTYEVIGSERRRREASDGEHGPHKRDRWDHRMDARAVGEPCIHERAREIDPTTQRRDQPLDDDHDLFGVDEADRGLLELPFALDPHATETVDHHLGHPLIAKKRRELAKPEQAVVEPALERPQLAGGYHNTLFGERLAKCRGEVLPTRTAIRRFS